MNIYSVSYNHTKNFSTKEKKAQIDIHGDMEENRFNAIRTGVLASIVAVNSELVFCLDNYRSNDINIDPRSSE